MYFAMTFIRNSIILKSKTFSLIIDHDCLKKKTTLNGDTWKYPGSKDISTRIIVDTHMYTVDTKWKVGGELEE